MLSGVAPKKRPGRKSEKKSTLGLWTTAALLLVVAAFLGVLELSRPRVDGDELRFDTWVQLVETDQINDARILGQDNYVIGEYKRPDGTVARYNAPLIEATQGSLVVNLLLANRVSITVDQQVRKQLASLASFLLPGLAIILLLAYTVLSSRRGTGLFKVKSGARKIESHPGSATFADIAGQDAAVLELREIRDYLTNPGRYESLGAQIPKGLLLYGPPGCGKTLLAEALASEAKASFYSISGSDFVELYVGVGAARVRELFKEARENAPAVIFIDEIDSIGRVRSTGDNLGGNSEQEASLTQVLTEMDGFSTSDGIIVVAATNRPDILDPALLRPGRFDRTVGLERPDEPARLAILTLHARGKRFEPGVDLAEVARRAVGLTGADLASVVNEGALLAARSGKAAIGQADLSEGLARIIEAPDRQRRLSLRGKSVGRRFTGSEKVTFDDVAGHEAAIKELREIRDYIADPDRYARLGARIPKGVLLYGPPGCGKTLLARALASEANAAFFSVGASDFASSLVGQGSTRVGDLFAEAKQSAPAIVFIDEIDTLGRSRVIAAGDNVGTSGQLDEQALNQLLTELDGFTTSSGVMVLGATNRADVLDPALLRAGRFDRSIALELPNAKAREAILSVHAADKVLSRAVRLDLIAEKAHGLTGADLANIMNEAALFAVRTGQPAVVQADIEAALQRTIENPDSQRRLSMRGASVGRRYSGSERITFADVAGVDDAIVELQDVKQFLTDPSAFERMGATAPKGILLSGPPGCGKTMLARAVAGEANAAFLSTSATDFVQTYVGVGAGRVRDLFAEARSIAPAIVFIDEIDSIGGHRRNSSDGGREVENTLNQLLVELDGFGARTGVVVMAATNRLDLLDTALIRPGRFDRKVQITLPDRAGRLAILQMYAKGKPLAPDVDLDALAGRCQGSSGAELHNILNEAALLGTRKGTNRQITWAHIEEAIDRAWDGISSSRAVMTLEERRVVAYHEAGHAVVALGIDGARIPHKLTILPTGSSLGHLAMRDTHDRTVKTRSMYMADLAVSFGGWATEKLVFGEVGSGASGDLEHINQLTRSMVFDWGMSDLGPMASSMSGTKGDSTTDASRDAIRALGDEACGKATAILTANRTAVDAIAMALLERETLSGDEVQEMFHRQANGGRRPVAPAGGRKRVRST